MRATTPMFRRTVTALSVVLVSLPVGAEAAQRGLPWLEPGGPAAGAEVVVTLPDGASRSVRRCSTPAGPTGARAEVEAALDLWRSLGPARRRGRGTIVVPVAVHVVRRDAAAGEVSDARIGRQIRVLNRVFRKSAFRFTLASVDRTESRKWHRGCRPYGDRGRLRRAYRKMAGRLAVDPASTLNVYACDLIGQGLLGAATAPWFFLGESPLDGVVVDYRTLPGGGATPRDGGGTLAHQVGHWLGLYDTFQDGCAAPGDAVADTPYEALAASGCPAARDSCTDDPGLDPTANVMDAGEDACARRLTKGQRRRMRTAVGLYRPGLGAGRGGAGDPRG